MIDFTECKTLKKAYGGMNGSKKCIIYNGEPYMLKLPTHPKRKTDLQYTNGCISEFVGCHIYEMLGIDVQETHIGSYSYAGKQYVAVICKDFVKPGFILQDFASIKNQVIESSTGGSDTELNEILATIEYQNILDPVIILTRFWDMFVIDTLLGNFDRHNGNWGFLYNVYEDTMELAPVYDCGSCLFPQADESMINRILTDIGELHTRIFNYPNSAIKVDGKKLSYYDFWQTTTDKMCLAELCKIFTKIDFRKINSFIDSLDFIDELQKQFYKTMLKARYDLILVPAYKRAINEEHTSIPTKMNF